MVRKLGQTLVGVVENMSGYACPCCGEQTAPFGEGGGARARRPARRAPAGRGAARARRCAKAPTTATPLMLSAPDSLAARAIAGLAERLDGPGRGPSPFAVVGG